jgi:hypothetical protein
MRRITKRHVNLTSNTTDGINGQTVLANFTPSGYTQTDNFISGHLDGIDSELVNKLSASAGDIDETSATLLNNQSSPINVTGLAFANGTVRSFQAQVCVIIDATVDLFEMFDLKGVQTASAWKMDISSVGDSSGVAFSITSAGQIQYTSGNQSGHVSSTIKFRAITISTGV